MDTIDVSNLNRQFLFRKNDTEKFKADVAAEFIMKRCKGVKVKAHHDNIMDHGKEFYKKFNIVIAGLDNIKARDWLNKTLIDLVEFGDDGEVNWETVVPFIDGGTTGFAGQARLVIPYKTACYHCTLASLPPEEGFHICTIASKPRKPEHCIAYAFMVEWALLEEFTNANQYKMRVPEKADAERDAPPPEGKIALDKDNSQHLTWIMQRALERAKKFSIQGVTYNMTMQVVKNIIPAIASTNAIIAAACVNEAWKYLARSHPRLNSYFQFYGHSGVACKTFPYQRDTDCDHCSSPISWKAKASDTLQSLLDRVKKELFSDETKMEDTKKEGKKKEKEKDGEEEGKKKKPKNPSLSMNDELLYIDLPGQDYSSELQSPLFALKLTKKHMIVAVDEERTRRIFLSITK